MPGFDGTGPRGMGPMTGGGRGFCAVPLPAAGPAYRGGVVYPPYGAPGGVSYYGGGPAVPGGMPFASQVTKEQQLGFLKSQAEMMRDQLGEIEARIQELGRKKE